jgi:hypothetical protein
MRIGDVVARDRWKQPGIPAVEKPPDTTIATARVAERMTTPTNGVSAGMGG